MNEANYSQSTPPLTVRPQDVFCDYEAVVRYLEEQKGRPSSPSECSSALCTPLQTVTELPDITDEDICEPPTTPLTPSPSPDYDAPRQVGAKSKRVAEDDDDTIRSTKRRAVTQEPSRKRKSPEDDQDFSPVPKRRAAQKAVRFSPLKDEDEEEEYVLSDVEAEMDVDEDDASDDFRPPRRPTQSTKASSASRTRNAGRKPASKNRKKAKAAAVKKEKKKPVTLNHCECGECERCQWTCPYVFTYGPHKGDRCSIMFESHRDLDFNRHKEAHGVHEWFWCRVVGKLTEEEARWWSVEFKGRPKGFFCPNHKAGWEVEKKIGSGDCLATFTRRDALIRHLKNHTCCPEFAPELRDEHDPTMVDPKKAVMESHNRWKFIQPFITETLAAQAAGNSLTTAQDDMLKNLAKFEHEKATALKSSRNDDDDD